MYPYGDLRILLEENENRLFLSIQKRNCPSPKIEEGRKKKEVKNGEWKIAAKQKRRYTAFLLQEILYALFG